MKAMCDLAYDLMDQEIEDTTLVSTNTDFEMMSSGIDGLVLTQPDKK